MHHVFFIHSSAHAHLGCFQAGVCLVMSNYLQPQGLWPTRFVCPGDSPGKNTGEGCHFLLLGIFQTQGLSACFLQLLHWQADSYHWATWEALLPVLVIVHSVTINYCVYVSFSITVSLGYMTSSGIARSYGSIIPSFLKESPYHSPYGSINLYSHQQCKRVPFSPQSPQHLFDYGHSDQCEMIPHCSFELHFSNNKWVLGVLWKEWC